MGADAGFVRTTVTLREDLYQRLRRGPRGLSENINDILAKEFQRSHRLFGSAKDVSPADVRDHDDRV